jgi:hypothetical protein
VPANVVDSGVAGILSEAEGDLGCWPKAKHAIAEHRKMREEHCQFMAGFYHGSLTGDCLLTRRPQRRRVDVQSMAAKQPERILAKLLFSAKEA